MLFANTLPTRADLFVLRHIDYINGRMKLIDAQTTNISTQKKANLNQNMETNLDEEQNLSVNKKITLYNIDTNVCLACQADNKSTNNYLCIAYNKSVCTSSGCSQIFILKKNLKNYKEFALPVKIPYLKKIL